MSAPRTSHRIPRRTIAAATTGLAAGLLLTLGGPAAADPPALHAERCAAELAKAATWPGGDSSGRRFFSDAYNSYLSQQPACTCGT